LIKSSSNQLFITRNKLK